MTASIDTASIDTAARKTDAWTWTLAALLVLLWGVVLIVLLTPEVPNGHGFEHAQFPTMDQGGGGEFRHGGLLAIGWMLGTVLIATFVSLLACGTVPVRTGTRWRLGAFCVGGLLYEGVFGMLCLSYRNSLAQSNATFFGPFPEPLAWLLFGIWLVPGVFVVLYVLFFYRWIWPPENSSRFAELVATGAKTVASHEPQ